MSGVLQTFLAEALVIPTGIVTTALLSVKLTAAVVLILLALLALGESSSDEIGWARSLLRWRTAASQPAPRDV